MGVLARTRACAVDVTAARRRALSIAVPLPFAARAGHTDRHACRSDACRVNCRVCGTSIVLDSRKIEQGLHYATIPCTSCSALVPIRRTDELHVIQEQVRERLERAPTGRRTVFDRWRRAH